MRGEWDLRQVQKTEKEEKGFMNILCPYFTFHFPGLDIHLENKGYLID